MRLRVSCLDRVQTRKELGSSLGSRVRKGELHWGISSLICQTAGMPSSTFKANVMI